MHATVLGSGSPIPLLERAGTSLALSLGDEEILIDCGPGTVYRLIENRIHPGEIETLFFTHQHMDHNADFPHFAIASWSLGREALQIYGPDGTDTLLDALYEVYREDIDYRRGMGYPETGMSDITWTQTTDDLAVEGDGWRATAREVDHSIETYAYRFEETATGATFVFSGDTRQTDAIVEFAAGADVLVQDCCVGPVGDAPATDGLVWERLLDPLSDEHRETLLETHCSPVQAGEIAAGAGVDTLVLTHLLPYRDTQAMCESARTAFDGDVVAAEDGLGLDIS